MLGFLVFSVLTAKLCCAVTLTAFQSTYNQGAVVTQTGAQWDLARIAHSTYQFDNNGQTCSTNPMNDYVYLKGSGDVTVYMIDTGVEVTHEEFGGRASQGANFVSGESSNDLNGHGTHLAGMAIGNTIGVARQASLVSVKVLDANREGPVEHFSSAVDWVIAQQQAKAPGSRAVINYSAVGNISQIRTDAINKAISSGIFVVTAAGNDNVDACGVGPANLGPQHAGQLVVAALNYTNTPANFTNYGRCVDVYAPGVDVLSSLPGSTSDYGYMDGTSNAAALVSGLVAYLWGRNSSLSLSDMTSLISTGNLNAVTENFPGTAGSVAYNFIS